MAKLDEIRAAEDQARDAAARRGRQLIAVDQVLAGLPSWAAWEPVGAAAALPVDDDHRVEARARIVAERFRGAHDRLATAEQQLADAETRHGRELLERDLLIRAFSEHVGEAEAARIEAEVASVIAPGT